LTKADERADDVIISAFEAHLSEIIGHTSRVRREVALRRVREECDALAREKGIGIRTARRAVNRLADRVL